MNAQMNAQIKAIEAALISAGFEIDSNSNDFIQVFEKNGRKPMLIRVAYDNEIELDIETGIRTFVTAENAAEVASKFYA